MLGDCGIYHAIFPNTSFSSIKSLAALDVSQYRVLFLRNESVFVSRHVPHPGYQVRDTRLNTRGRRVVGVQGQLTEPSDSLDTSSGIAASLALVLSFVLQNLRNSFQHQSIHRRKKERQVAWMLSYSLSVFRLPTEDSVRDTQTSVELRTKDQNPTFQKATPEAVFEELLEVSVEEGVGWHGMGERERGSYSSSSFVQRFLLSIYEEAEEEAFLLAHNERRRRKKIQQLRGNSLPYLYPLPSLPFPSLPFPRSVQTNTLFVSPTRPCYSNQHSPHLTPFQPTKQPTTRYSLVAISLCAGHRKHTHHAGKKSYLICLVYLHIDLIYLSA